MYILLGPISIANVNPIYRQPGRASSDDNIAIPNPARCAGLLCNRPFGAQNGNVSDDTTLLRQSLVPLGHLATYCGQIRMYPCGLRPRNLCQRCFGCASVDCSGRTRGELWQALTSLRQISDQVVLVLCVQCHKKLHAGKLPDIRYINGREI